MSATVGKLLPAIPLVALLASQGMALRITIPAEQFKPLERIPAEVQNNSNGPVTFCVEFGQTSPSSNENGIKATPSPFIVQANSAGKWHTLLNGPDVGSSRHPVVVESKKSEPFPLRLRDTGQVRLLLWYWQGSMPDLDCGHPPKGEKRLESKPFRIQ